MGGELHPGVEADQLLAFARKLFVPPYGHPKGAELRGCRHRATRIVGSSPQHQMLVQSSFDLPRGVAFDLDYRYVSALPRPSRSRHIPRAMLVSAGDSASLGNLRSPGKTCFSPITSSSQADPGPNVEIKRSVYGKIVWTSKEN